ncbi:MAG TPA: DEAD/DEAH box helicase, partial [Gammaproteobacteria bacterium]|nr:DEAD/DEAH box helicase [Gammaproteobacteria bacterium]
MHTTSPGRSSASMVVALSVTKTRNQEAIKRLLFHIHHESNMSQTPLTIDFDDSLPINQRRDEIAETIQQNQVTILCGETGSGKTTQLPKICLSIGRGEKQKIGHTQPRRIAARAVAGRIAEELKSTPGELVGFKIRFSDQSKKSSRIKLMTDGILLAETQSDPLLKQYDTLIIDEAHERSLNIDFLLGYLRQILPKRPDLKLIITSATIDPDRFSRHFNNAPALNVSGRT